MKNTKNRFKYEYIVIPMFVVIIAVGFCINAKETIDVGQWKEADGIVGKVKAVCADMSSLESIVYPAINLNGLYQRVMQRNYMYDVDESNNLIKTKDGYLTSCSTAESEIDEARETADTLVETSEYLRNKGIPTLYVQAISKGSISEADQMIGQKNYTYGKANAFISELRAHGVDVVDTKEIFEKPGNNLFFRTDHHWTIQTALNVSEYICGYMNEKYGFNLDKKLYEKNCFKIENHSKAFLGAEGRRTGKYYVGLDDFASLTPKFKSEFDIDIVNSEGEKFKRHGDFKDTILDRTKDIDSYSFEDSAYYYYWGGDYGHVHVENNALPEGKKVVLIKDSFGIPVSAFMTCAFKSMDIVDMRYYCDKESVMTMIDKLHPDAVIYVYGTGYLTKDYMFELDK